MNDPSAPYHAHIYFDSSTRALADALRSRFRSMMESGQMPDLVFVGSLRDQKVGPHPVPQFEIHFRQRIVAALLPLLEATGLTALVHPLTDDDLADHTSLAHWIGAPLELDLTTLDPPGINQGIARFARTDF